MAASREEQEMVEELWRSSARSYGEARRRAVCVEWVEHHKRLALTFDSFRAHHAREQEHYERILAEESEDAEQA